MDKIDSILEVLTKVFLDWGVLLEILSIVLIVPLTAYMVERNRLKKLRMPKTYCYFAKAIGVRNIQLAQDFL